MNELPEYAAYAWSYMDSPDKNSVEMALRMRIFYLIYSAAKTGDSYSVALMNYLSQKYYKKEYQILKRYSSITENPTIFVIDPLFIETTEPYRFRQSFESTPREYRKLLYSILDA